MSSDGDHEADRAAGLLQGLGVAELRAAAMPLAMCTMPSTPNSSAAQPMTWRPAGPLRSGSRRLRQATKHSSSGTNQPSRPTEPATTVRVTSPTPPGSCHHTGGGDHDREADEEQPGPVATVLGVEVAGGVADLADGGAEDVRDAEPDGGQRRGRGRARSGRPGRCRCGPRGARALRGRAPLRPARARLARARLAGAAARRTGRGGGRLRAGRAHRTSTCLCSATPEGKTYGSPCSEIYGIATPVPCFTRRSGAGRRAALRGLLRFGANPQVEGPPHCGLGPIRMSKGPAACGSCPIGDHRHNEPDIQ